MVNQVIRHAATLVCISFIIAILGVASAQPVPVAPGTPGSAESPLRVMLVPTDGGTEAGTRADFAPIFNAVSRTTGLQFQIRVGQSYASVAEGMINNLVDIAFVGPTLYLQIAARDAAEPLAVAVLDGESVYYAGIFARAGTELADLSEIRGRSMAFGDVNSSTSFTIQTAMLIAAGVDPSRDLSAIFMTGGHTNSLNALIQGHVEFSAASFNSYTRGVSSGAIDSDEIVPVAVSAPVPYPPFIMRPTLSDDVKDRLRHGFNTVHEDPAINPEMIRGFGSILVDRYTADITHADFQKVQEMLDMVTNEIKGDMLRRASQR
jgi:phosphonate transport system substrate-binding protein